MNFAGSQLLARATFAEDEYVRIGGRGTADDAEYSLQGRGAANQLPFGWRRLADQDVVASLQFGGPALCLRKGDGR